MGAPVMAFCRIDDREIRLREPVVEPDAVLIQDAALLHSVEVFQGLRPDGYVLINTGKELAALGLDDLRARLPPGHLRTVAATELAMKHVGRPVPSGALLGGFVALSREISLSSLERALRERFAGKVAEVNVAAAREAFAAVQDGSPC
jgi:pyruvate ferredoxin oxidoreductase gamma subunit